MGSPNRETCELMNKPCPKFIETIDGNATTWRYLCRLAKLGNVSGERPIDTHKAGIWSEIFEHNTPLSATYIFASTRLFTIIPWHSCRECTANVRRILFEDLGMALASRQTLIS